MSAVGRREFLSMLGAPAFAAKPARKYNFVLFLVDDMGWRDLACTGSKYYETPNIDALAREGVRFANAYAAAPVCSPTRGAIMTGKYPARLGMTHITGFRPNPKAEWVNPPTASELALEETTIAEALKAQGYATASIGKWHLGKEPFYPLHQGFDINIGGTEMAMPPDFFYPQWKQPGGYFKMRMGVPIEGQPGEYLTDRLTDEALKFIESKRNQPFFLYLSHFAVHVPIQAKQEAVEAFRRKVREGDPQNNPVYAAMIQSLDESMARVRKKLNELGIADHTVIIFASDNGGLHKEDGPNTPPTSNLPARNGKMSLYEGGIRVPTIIHWPGVTKGTVSDVPMISNDFYPTMLDIAGVRSNPVDGVSLTPLLKGKKSIKRDALYWHYPHGGYFSKIPAGMSAMRQGDFKLIELLDGGNLELYDLAEDIGETKNLAQAMPKKTAAMLASLRAWRESVGAKPLTHNPDYKPQ